MARRLAIITFFVSYTLWATSFTPPAKLIANCAEMLKELLITHDENKPISKNNFQTLILPKKTHDIDTQRKPIDVLRSLQKALYDEHGAIMSFIINQKIEKSKELTIPELAVIADETYHAYFNILEDQYNKSSQKFKRYYELAQKQADKSITEEEAKESNRVANAVEAFENKKIDIILNEIGTYVHFRNFMIDFVNVILKHQ